jgi:hypothetical protein
MSHNKKKSQFEIWNFNYLCFICHYDYTFNVYNLIDKIESFLYEMINWIFLFTCVEIFHIKLSFQPIVMLILNTLHLVAYK